MTVLTITCSNNNNNYSYLACLHLSVLRKFHIVTLNYVQIVIAF